VDLCSPCHAVAGEQAVFSAVNAVVSLLSNSLSAPFSISLPKACAASWHITNPWTSVPADSLTTNSVERRDTQP